MKIYEKELREQLQDIANNCMKSVATRGGIYDTYRKYFFDGAGDNSGEGPSVSDYNKINSHIDELASYLYSPAEVRFLLEPTRANADPKTISRYSTASSFLSRQFHLRDCDLSIGRGVVWALVYGSTFMKYVWNGPQKIEKVDDLPVIMPGGEIDSYVVMPYHLGVIREDINGLDRQEAICQTNYVLIDELDRQLRKHPDYRELIDEIKNGVSANPENGGLPHSVFIGGNHPIVGGSNLVGSAGNVSLMSNTPKLEMSPEVMRRLVRVDELWVWDDDRDDYTTFIKANEGPVIEGRLKRRNLNVPGEHPYAQICPNELEGVFFGVSEITQIRRLQDRLNRRMDDRDDLIDRNVDVARVFTGFNGVTDEKAAALNTPGGWFSESDPNGKIQDLAPPIPKELEEEIQMLNGMFQDQGGLSSVLQGQGESGVRSAQHAETLVRTSSPRLRDRSLLIERQVAMCGYKVWRLLQEKIADQFTTEDKQQFTLAQIEDEDYKMTVDSHSSSPVFSKEAKDSVLLLAKLGVIDGESILDLLQPPMMDTLKMRFRQKQAAQAKFAKEHPELAVEGGRGKKKGGLSGLFGR